MDQLRQATRVSFVAGAAWLAAATTLLTMGRATAGQLPALSSAERVRVLSVACGSRTSQANPAPPVRLAPAAPVGEETSSIEVAAGANRAEERAGARLVRVRCAPQERVANVPVRSLQLCTLRAGVWTCESQGREVVLALNGRRVTVQFPVALDAWAAYQMSRAMGPVAVPLAVPGSGGQTARCTLAGDNSDAAVARMTLDCDLYTVVFVKLCTDSQCRFETVSRYAKRVQRLGLTMATTPKAGWSR